MSVIKIILNRANEAINKCVFFFHPMVGETVSVWLDLGKLIHGNNAFTAGENREIATRQEEIKSGILEIISIF